MQSSGKKDRTPDMLGHAVEQVVEARATSRNVAGSIPDGVTVNFIDLILPPALPWGRLSL